MSASRLVCQGCGVAIGASELPYRCPNAGADDADHVVARVLDPEQARFPSSSSEPNPFVRYRGLTHAHALALSHGVSDEAFVALARELDARVAAVGGVGFQRTPLSAVPELARRLGAGIVWVKDETGNVSGSHKGRHLMGLAVLGEVRARLGLDPPGARLAIASCGNAALAAAIVARAWGRPLDVFIPPDANPNVVARLRALDATVHVCERVAGVPGDPCTRAFRAAVSDGATPFCCQGTDNGMTIEGGETLAWELIDALGGQPIDRLFVQVGGGALASACVQGFQDALRLGLPVRLPRLHAVQTRGGFPLWRAWRRLAERIAARLGLEVPDADAALADALWPRAQSPEVARELAWAARNRSAFMWPWETEPRSVAHGILDDETYDWFAVVRGMLLTGGFPVVVDEARLLEANALGRAATGIDADETGTAGLAGALELAPFTAAETVAVIFSGHRR